MNNDNQEIIYCADDNEFRIYCDVCDKLVWKDIIKIISNHQLTLIIFVKENNRRKDFKKYYLNTYGLLL